MADFYPPEAVGVFDRAVATDRVNGALVYAKRRHIRANHTLAAQPAGSRLFVGRFPAGAVFDGVTKIASVSLGGATLAIGTTAVPAKYQDPAAFTAVDAPTISGKAAAYAADPLIAFEDVWATVAGGALPAAGTLVIKLHFTVTR